MKLLELFTSLLSEDLKKLLNIPTKQTKKCVEENSELLMLAEQGDINAQYKLGVQLMSEEKYKEAHIWLEKVSIGKPEAYGFLAMLYSAGLGCPIDKKKAWDLAITAEKKGSLLGVAIQGRWYKLGDGIKANTEKAFKLLEKVVSSISDEYYKIGFQWILGLYADELIRRNKTLDAIKWANKGVTYKDCASYVILGLLYLTGNGVNQDVEMAIQYLKQAISKSNPPKDYIELAYAALGDIYSAKGDLKNALSNIRKAAELGNAVCMHTMSLAYRNGRGVIKDMDKAIEWEQKAIAAGYIAQ